MSFVVRAGLAIAILSYFAATREQSGPLPRPDAAAAAATLAAAWDGLPPELRQRVGRDAVEIAGSLPGSRDTLAEADRRPAWRGIEGR